LIVVLGVSALAVTRLHKIFGSQDLNANAGAGIEIVQFNPKLVDYEMSGPPGATANINYWDEHANPHQVHAPAACRRRSDHAVGGEPTSWRVRRQPNHCKITVDGACANSKTPMATTPRPSAR
jgi:hypothetical protein